MKPGSIVICLFVETHPDWNPYVKWLPKMDEKTPYMIREILESDNNIIGVYFEEGIIGYNSRNQELLFPISHVREILPPDEISEEIKEIIYEDDLISI